MSTAEGAIEESKSSRAPTEAYLAVMVVGELDLNILYLASRDLVV